MLSETRIVLLCFTLTSLGIGSSLLCAQQRPLGDETDIPLNALTPPPNGPTEVSIDIYGIEIFSINEREETFEIEAFLDAGWFDPRLAFDSKKLGTNVLIYQGAAAIQQLDKKIWWPYFEIIDARGARERMYTELRIYADGKVNYAERFQTLIIQEFDLESFPFDWHSISFSIRPYSDHYSEEDVVFVLDMPTDDPWNPEDWTVNWTELRVNEYDVYDLRSNPEDYRKIEEEDREESLIISLSKNGELDFRIFKNGEEEYLAEKDLPPSTKKELQQLKNKLGDPLSDASRFLPLTDQTIINLTRDIFDLTPFPEATVEMEITRKPLYYISNVIMPLALIVGISSCVFWMSFETMNLGNRLSVAITSLLTVVAFDFVTADSLPKLSYSTVMDHIISLSYLFVAINIFQSVLSDKLNKKKPAAAELLDKLFRWTFTPVFLIIILILIGPAVYSTYYNS